MGTLKLPKIAERLRLPLARNQKLCVGLDIGSHAVKVCEMKKTAAGLRLVSLGSARMPEGALEDGALQDSEAVAAVIQALYKNLNIKEKRVALSVSGYSVIVKKINLAVMSDDDMASHIQAEAEQYIPFDIDDVYLDFHNLHTNTDEEERTDVMLVAAKKEVVNGYLDMLRSIGLRPVLVDVDAFALENAYGTTFDTEQNVALIDIGASKMNINIIAHGSSALVRDVVLGSRQLTEQVQGRFDISFDEAESVKLGVFSAEDREEELKEVFSNTCEQWVAETRKALDFYSSNFPEETISQLILSGGGARINGLARYFQEETEIPVVIFDPFARVGADTNSIDPQYLEYMAPEMALAAGLASRPIEL